MTKDERIDQALEGRLSAEDWRQLRADVIADDEFRAAWVERAWLHGQLLAERDSLPDLLDAEPPVARSSRWTPILWAAAAAIVTALIVLSIPRGEEFRPVATLAEAEGCKWAGSDLPTAEGAQLGAGTLSLVEGMATLEFESGAVVTLEAPTTLEVLSKMHCRLVEGSVVADVPESAHGFKIDTPDLEVVDLGTRFGVTANAFGNSHVLVFEGEVEVGGAGDEVKRLTTGGTLHHGSNPPLADQEIARAPAPAAAEDGWLGLTPSKDAYVRSGDPHGPTGAHPLIMVKQTDLAEGNRRRAFLSFELPTAEEIRAAELILDVEPSGLGFSALVPDSRFAVFGLAADDWNEAELLWTNAPSLDTAKRLGEFTIRRGAATSQVSISTPELADFLREDDNQIATFAIVRETGETDRQGLVHAFASKEHPSARPPVLRLKTSK